MQEACVRPTHAGGLCKACALDRYGNTANRAAVPSGTMQTAYGLISQWATGGISSLDVVKRALDNVADNAAAPLTIRLSQLGARGGFAHIDT